MKKIFLLIPILLLFASCDKDFEEINTNPNAATEIDPKLLFSTALLQGAGNTKQMEGAVLSNASCYIQHLAALAFNWKGDKYFFDPFNNDVMFSDGYRNEVKTIVDMLEKVKEDPEQINLYAAGRIWKTLIFHRITDLYGDIPYFEAGRGFLDGVLSPVYDRQEDIYLDMLSELEAATRDLDSSKPFIGDADFIYYGDVEKWRRFGNTLMLRMALRLTKVDPATAESWTKKAIAGGVMQTLDDTAIINHSDGIDLVKNGLADVFETDDNSRLSKTFVDWMKDSNDPRLPILGSVADSLEHKGLPNGWDDNILLEMTGLTDIETYSRLNRIFVQAWSPTIFQGYAEAELMLAEAATRNWHTGDAVSHFEKGVRAAMQQLALYDDAATIEETAIDTFLINNPYLPANTEEALEIINSHYWAATFLNELESYANWRRTGYPVLTPTNFQGNDSGGTIPRRFRYPQEEYSVNIENVNAAVSRQGSDLITTRVWWDE